MYVVRMCTTESYIESHKGPNRKRAFSSLFALEERRFQNLRGRRGKIQYNTTKHYNTIVGAKVFLRVSLLATRFSRLKVGEADKKLEKRCNFDTLKLESLLKGRFS